MSTLNYLTVQVSMANVDIPALTAAFRFVRVNSVTPSTAKVQFRLTDKDSTGTYFPVQFTTPSRLQRPPQMLPWLGLNILCDTVGAVIELYWSNDENLIVDPEPAGGASGIQKVDVEQIGGVAVTATPGAANNIPFVAEVLDVRTGLPVQLSGANFGPVWDPLGGTPILGPEFTFTWSLAGLIDTSSELIAASPGTNFFCPQDFAGHLSTPMQTGVNVSNGFNSAPGLVFGALGFGNLQVVGTVRVSVLVPGVSTALQFADAADNPIPVYDGQTGLILPGGIPMTATAGQIFYIPCVGVTALTAAGDAAWSFYCGFSSHVFKP